MVSHARQNETYVFYNPYKNEKDAECVPNQYLLMSPTGPTPKTQQPYFHNVCIFPVAQTQKNEKVPNTHPVICQRSTRARFDNIAKTENLKRNVHAFFTKCKKHVFHCFARLVFQLAVFFALFARSPAIFDTWYRVPGTWYWG